MKDHEETLKPDQRKAKILQGPVSQVIKTQKLEKPRIDLIAQLLGQTVRQALIHYSEEDKGQKIEKLSTMSLFFPKKK